MSSNAFHTGLTHHISKGVTLRTSYARYKCMVVLCYKLVAFIPNTKDVWDFCLGGLNKKGEKQNEILSVLYEVHLAYEKAIKEDLSKFKRYQDALHSIKLDLMQKGFDYFSDASFNKIESLKKEFSEQERSKRENLAQLNQVINLFKKSIDKVFDRVSAFTWEKYKEENDDEENNDEENYQEFEEIKEETNRREREFEEIKKIVSECRDYNKLYIENSGLSFEELQGHRDEVNYFNELLQSEFSMKNLLTLRQFKDI